ncbi:MAG: hypothetical protein EOP11_25260 [Proteobacteria bacterium]|nr:MAG: hypothetical protein EOP11_25260 [Pseudomonadota bacterium]
MRFLSLALAFSSLAAVSAQAESFTCGFTEPFFTIEYSTTTQKLVLTDNALEKSTNYRGVEFQIVAPGEFTLRDKRGHELARLKLTMEGSDGMSATIYPYEISTKLLGGANNGEGGCASSLLKTKQGES